MRLPEHIYHLADATNWPSIQKDGLHCANVLIQRSGLHGAAREALARRQRLTGTELPNGIRLRDQCPMPAAALARCLVGMSPADWYALINTRVFFWLNPDRLNRQRRACGARPQVVLTVDTAKLISVWGHRISLTPINTGNARRQPARRCAATFVSYKTWLESAWSSEAAALGTKPRPRSHVPTELTVEGSIPDAMRFVVRVRELGANDAFVAQG
jgi:hypothetical protein